MKRGDVIRGYQIVSDPTNNEGGKCIWAFAEKDGKKYFIKRFLEPKRPRLDSSASELSKRRRLKECEEFENRHQSIMKLLRPNDVGAGNLVLAVDLFCTGSTYYKVTEWIDTTTLETPQQLDPRKKAVLLKTLGLSLSLLHKIDVVHGDLKPGNVLVQKKPGNTFYTAKLIDFDDSYISKNPPERDSIPGDPLFGAPEWRRYLQGDESVLPEFLTTSVDVFALGLMTHYYLTGDLPGFDDKYDAPADAVNDDVRLRIDDRLTNTMRELVRAMTSQSPGARPRVSTFLDTLGDPAVCALTRRRRPRGAPAETGSTTPRRTPGDGGGFPFSARNGASTGRLRGNFGDSAAANTSDPLVHGASKGGPERTSRVRMNLHGNRTGRRP